MTAIWVVDHLFNGSYELACTCASAAFFVAVVAAALVYDDWRYRNGR